MENVLLWLKETSTTSARIIVDHTILDVIDFESDEGESYAGTLVDFMLYAKQEKDVETLTTDRVWDKAEEMWPYEIQEYVTVVIEPSEIQFNGETKRESVKELAKASSKVDQAYLLTKDEYPDLKDRSSILIWIP